MIHNVAESCEIVIIKNTYIWKSLSGAIASLRICLTSLLRNPETGKIFKTEKTVNKNTIYFNIFVDLSISKSNFFLPFISPLTVYELLKLIYFSNIKLNFKISLGHMYLNCNKYYLISNNVVHSMKLVIKKRPITL